MLMGKQTEMYSQNHGNRFVFGTDVPGGQGTSWSTFTAKVLEESLVNSSPLLTSQKITASYFKLH